MEDKIKRLHYLTEQWLGNDDEKYDEILTMNPEIQSKYKDQKTSKIHEEKNPRVKTNVDASNFPSTEKQINYNTLNQNISQDTLKSENSEEIYSCQLDTASDNINQKITDFLQWGDKSNSEQKNTHNDNSFKSRQSGDRLQSRSDKYNQNSNDQNNITRSDSFQVYWNDNIEYYNYPAESSTSTVGTNTNYSEDNSSTQTQSQANLPNYDVAKPNYIDKQKNQNSNDQNNIKRSDSFQVYWNDNVEYYNYPTESSTSTVGINTNYSEDNNTTQTRSQANLPNYDVAKPNYIDKQKNPPNVICQKSRNYENSRVSNSMSKLTNNCIRDKYEQNLLTNKTENTSNFNRQRKCIERDSKVLGQNYLQNNCGIKTTKHEPHCLNKNQSDTKCHIHKNSKSNDSYQCKTNLSPFDVNYNMPMEGVHQNYFEKTNVSQTKYLDFSEKFKPKNNYSKCQVCGYQPHQRYDKCIEDTTNSYSISKRNEKLRKLLGISPEDKNVIVMLKL